MEFRLPKVAHLIAALMLAIMVTPAFAQTPEEDIEDPPFDRDCMDEYARNLCNPEVMAKILTKFGMETAEQVQAQGWRGVRVFTVNGYSMDMPMISVLAKGEDKHGAPIDAVLEVRLDVYGGENPKPGLLTRPAWDNLYWVATDLQDLVAKSPERVSDEETNTAASGDKDDDVIIVCLHSWVNVTESLTDTGVVRRIRDSCGNDPVYDAAFDLSAQALRGFPHCNHIDPANERNAFTQLATCMGLTGEDRIAAAEVLALFSADGFEHATDLIPHLSANARIVLPGETKPTPRAAAIKTLSAAPFDAFSVYTYNIDGAPGRVTVIGALDRDLEQGYEISDMRQTWRKQDGLWRLTDLTFGPITREQ